MVSYVQSASVDIKLALSVFYKSSSIELHEARQKQAIKALCIINGKAIPCVLAADNKR